jgi:actin related protein 2/3 complex subunit 1A/1B
MGSYNFFSLIWVTPNSIITVGHDCTPVLVSKSGSNTWQVMEKLDQGVKKASASSNTAFNKFRQMDSRAQTEQTGTELNTIHQNTITLIRPYEGPRNNVQLFTTSGVDGRLTVWNVKSIERAISGLRIN